MPRTRVLPALLLAWSLICPAGVPAGEPAGAAGHAANRLDPTDFRTRYDFRNRYQAPQTGGYRNFANSRLDYAFSKDFVVRAELPYVHSAPHRPGTPAESGLGDLMLRPSFRVKRTPGYALVVGSEFTFDTAESRLLGAGKYVIAPIAFLSREVPALRTTFFPTLQYYRSIGGDDARPDINYTNIKLFALTRWPWHLYTGTEAVLFVDHAHRGRVGATVEVETGWFLNPHVALWLRPGVGTHGDDIPQVYSWNFEVGFRYLFD
ncbi:MAG: hypothetical protein AB7S57_25200 [Acetobacteraceae bacterium]